MGLCRNLGQPNFAERSPYLNELMIRFVVGGFVVSAFSLISDLFKPKTFAGLFGAVPSVALASLALTIFKMGRGTAAVEARAP